MIKKKIEELKGPCEPEPEPEESFNPIEREQAFSRAYRSYRISGTPRMDVDTFFEQIRQNLMKQEPPPSSNLGLDLGSARVLTTTWIRFKRALEDDFGFDRVELPFNSRMTEIFQGSDLNEIVNEMFAHMVMQIRNPALRNSRFVFNEVLFLDVKASYI